MAPGNDKQQASKSLTPPDPKDKRRASKSLTPPDPKRIAPENRFRAKAARRRLGGDSADLPSLTDSSTETPANYTPPEAHDAGTRPSRFWRDAGDYWFTWRECTVLEDTFDQSRPPFMRVRIIEDEMTLPVSNRRDDITEMDIDIAIPDIDKNWKDEIVTLHFRCDSVHARNGPYHFWVIFLGREEDAPPREEEPPNDSEAQTP